MSNLVVTDVHEGVMTLTINRPDARNALDYATALALAQALDQMDGDDSVVIGILTGAGNSFSAGMDLKAFAKTGERPLVEGRGLGGLCEKGPQKPLIAAVEGYALAGGFELALACDLIVAAENATFGLPEVKRGLVASSGGLLRLPKRIPYHIAMEVILTGDMFPAQRAFEYGLINRLTEPGKALETARELAHVVAQNGPMAVRVAKEIVGRSENWRSDEMYDIQRPYITRVFPSEDAKEGATAFAEKRKPVWKGR